MRNAPKQLFFHYHNTNRKSKSCLQLVKKVEPKAVFLCSTSLSFNSSVLCVSGLYWKWESACSIVYQRFLSQILFLISKDVVMIEFNILEKFYSLKNSFAAIWWSNDEFSIQTLMTYLSICYLRVRLFVWSPVLIFNTCVRYPMHRVSKPFSNLLRLKILSCDWTTP